MQSTERQIRLMTNSHKSQSEKLATGGGRETTAEKPYEVPGPHNPHMDPGSDLRTMRPFYNTF
jgi:hypothetical protein